MKNNNKPKNKKIKSKPISDYQTANQYYQNSKSKYVFHQNSVKTVHVTPKTYQYNNDQLIEIRKNSPGFCRKCGAEEYKDRFCWECYKMEKTQ